MATLGYLLSLITQRGIPAGGTIRQVLGKSSATDYAVGWQAGSGWDVELTSTGDETATNVQNQDHTQLQFAVVSGEVWYFEAELAVSANDATGDVATNLVTSGTWVTTASWSRAVHYDGAAALTNRLPAAAASTTNMVASPGLTSGNGDGSIFPVVWSGAFRATGNGTAKVQFGVVTTTVGRTATLYKNSRLRARRIRIA